jgi:hypothetical protein
VVEAGFSFWSTQLHEFFPMGGIYARLHPATGDAAATEAAITEDFPGHVVASMVVPEGGLGDLEVGVRESACTAPGGCPDLEARFDIAGVGPPPDAAPSDLIAAEILPLVGDTVVGREFPISAKVLPRGLWSFDTLALPDHLVAVARRPGGPELASGELRPSGQRGTPFTGRLSIPEAGDMQISVALPLDGGGAREIPGSAVQRTVIEGGPKATGGTSGSGAPGPASPGQAGPASGIPPVVLVIGIGALILAGLFGLNRLLRDL